MATGRPRFQVDSGFNDSKELLSIPSRQRLAARGAWEAAGCWSCDKLTDGAVPVYILRSLGVTPKLAELLIASTLWIPVDDPTVAASSRDRWTVATGPLTAIQFDNWERWQMTREKWERQVSSDAQRARAYRQRRKQEQPENVTRDADVTECDGDDDRQSSVTRDVTGQRHAVEISRDKRELSRELTAVGSADSPPPLEFPDHCSKHRHDPEPPRCNDCRRVREQNHHVDAIEAETAAAQRATERDRQRNCPTCEGHGHVQVDPTDPDPWAEVRPCPDCRGGAR